MHKHDEPWVLSQIRLIPQRYRKQTLEKYAQAFDAAYAKEPAPHRKDCMARRHANTKLRKYCDKVRITLAKV